MPESPDPLFSLVKDNSIYDKNTNFCHLVIFVIIFGSFQARNAPKPIFGRRGTHTQFPAPPLDAFGVSIYAPTAPWFNLSWSPHFVNTGSDPDYG